MQGSLSATRPHARGMEHEQTRMLEGEKNNAGRDSESWIIMSRHYNWTNRIPYLFSPALPPATTYEKVVCTFTDKDLEQKLRSFAN